MIVCFSFNERCFDGDTMRGFAGELVKFSVMEKSEKDTLSERELRLFDLLIVINGVKVDNTALHGIGKTLCIDFRAFGHLGTHQIREPVEALFFSRLQKTKKNTGRDTEIRTRSETERHQRRLSRDFAPCLPECHVP